MSIMQRRRPKLILSFFLPHSLFSGILRLLEQVLAGTHASKLIQWKWVFRRRRRLRSRQHLQQWWFQMRLEWSDLGWNNKRQITKCCSVETPWWTSVNAPKQIESKIVPFLVCLFVWDSMSFVYVLILRCKRLMRRCLTQRRPKLNALCAVCVVRKIMSRVIQNEKARSFCFQYHPPKEQPTAARGGFQIKHVQRHSLLHSPSHV